MMFAFGDSRVHRLRRASDARIDGGSHAQSWTQLSMDGKAGAQVGGLHDSAVVLVNNHDHHEQFGPAVDGVTRG
ncbi:MAG: hypothetical protein HY288_03535 [Planctomycetia bacterium]|nr:hypothetical protein [Planctomycetia bacterium]